MSVPSDPPEDRLRAAAVAEAWTVFDDNWPRWADAHGVPAGRPLTWEPPRVTVVGTDVTHLQHVAVLRFSFEHGGRRFEGLARGPAAAPTFRVWLLAAPPGAGPDRWWRRRGDRPTARHRASTRSL